MGYGNASHFANNANYEVQRTNNFEIEISGLTGNTAEVIRLSVQSVKIPSLNLEVIELRHGNTTVKVAGAHSYEGGDLVCVDAIGADTEMALFNWYQATYDPDTGYVGKAVDYKKVCRLHQYSPDGKTVRTWRLEGVFPTAFDPGELNYDGSDKKTLTLSLSIDKCQPDKR